VSRKKECCDCGRALKKDEVALTRKLIDVDTEEFYCLDCLSEFLGCTVQDLKEKIQEFKEQGCTLFL
jgi:biotin operon repressor